MSQALSVAASLSAYSSPRHRHPSVFVLTAYQRLGCDPSGKLKFVYQQGDNIQYGKARFMESYSINKPQV